jgi:hypothetical protein
VVRRVRTGVPERAFKEASFTVRRSFASSQREVEQLTVIIDADFCTCDA